MSYITVADLRIASPCVAAEWSSEKSEPFARHCATCDKSVYNLSLMTSDEANELIREKQGKLCVTLYQGFNGKVLTADAPIGFKTLRRKYLKTRSWIVCFALGLWGLMTGTSSCTEPSVVNGLFLDPDTHFNATINGNRWQLSQPVVPDIGIDDTTVNEIWISATRLSDSSSLWIFLDSTERAPGTYENHHGAFEAGGYADKDSNRYIWYAGELKIASIDSTHATGSFWFNAKRTTPSPDTVSVTNGNFDVPIEFGKIPR
jgi:hypothetical protein